MPSDANRLLNEQLEAELRALDARSQCRGVAEIRGVNLCSNDYLGLAGDPRLRAAVAEAVIEAPRAGATGSRLLSGHTRGWEELEDEFARFAGTEAALFFNSGYAANAGLLASLAGRNDVVFSDALNHASLIDGIRLSGARKEIYPHLDLDALEAALRRHAHENCRKVIVSETVFSMDGDAADVSALFALGARYGAALILDEAHATAVHGPEGRGIAAGALAAGDAFAVVHTCGKALASAGAFVCGGSVLKEHLINHARTFIFSTALPPYLPGQIRAALRLASGMNRERQALLANARSFAASLREQGWDTRQSGSQIVPAIAGSNEQALAAAEFLQVEGFAVRAIRPPTVPPGTSRLRFSLTSAVSVPDLERLASCLGLWMRNHPARAEAVSA